MDTYFYFVVGYMIFWLFPFVFLAMIFRKIKKLEADLKEFKAK